MKIFEETFEEISIMCFLISCIRNSFKTQRKRIGNKPTFEDEVSTSLLVSSQITQSIKNLPCNGRKHDWGVLGREGRFQPQKTVDFRYFRLKLSILRFWLENSGVDKSSKKSKLCHKLILKFRNSAMIFFKRYLILWKVTERNFLFWLKN